MNEALSRNLSPVLVDKRPTANGRNVLAIIGIDDYLYWPKLDNAVSDAHGIQELFSQLLNFEVPLSPLLNNNATKQTILSLVHDELSTQLKSEDNLLIFFAGHGHSRLSKVGRQEYETGYIIPVEARADRWSDYITIEELLRGIARLPARHILIILDSCRSGIALSDTKQSVRSRGSYEEKLSKEISRKVITSARRGEDAKDAGPIPRHSLFTGILIEGFRSGEIDNDHNGIVTSSELGLFLQQRVGQTPGTKQTPDFGPFYHDERGEMVLNLPKMKAASAPYQAAPNYNQKELEENIKRYLESKRELAKAKYEMMEADHEAIKLELLLSQGNSEILKIVIESTFQEMASPPSVTIR